MISGMLYHCEPKQRIPFLVKKLKSLGIPWLISASCVYLYVYLRKPPISLSSWFNFIIGNRSYTYYMTMLFTFFVVFSFRVLTKNAVLLVSIGISLITVFLIPSALFPTPYLNPFNWIGYFALGILIRNNKERLMEHRNHVAHYGWIVIVAYVVLLTYQVLNENGGSYWQGVNVIVSWCGAACIFEIGFAIKRTSKRMKSGISFFGRNTYFMYLWHMPIAGIIANLFNRGIPNLVFVRPFLVYSIMAVAVAVLNRLIAHKPKLGILFGVNR